MSYYKINDILQDVGSRNPPCIRNLTITLQSVRIHVFFLEINFILWKTLYIVQNIIIEMVIFLYSSDEWF